MKKFIGIMIIVCFIYGVFFLGFLDLEPQVPGYQPSNFWYTIGGLMVEFILLAVWFYLPDKPRLPNRIYR